jgi:hypothetical protein
MESVEAGSPWLSYDGEVFLLGKERQRRLGLLGYKAGASPYVSGRSD